MARLPALPKLNDLPAFADLLEQAAVAHGLTYELVVAQAMQESSWTLKAYRYEPNYDRRYVTGAAQFREDPAWLSVGPTVAEWFAQHPARNKEQMAGVAYDFVAQTRIAASYGVLQIMYPTALAIGYRGTPEELWQPTMLVWPVKFLGLQLKWAHSQGWAGTNALRVALAVFNGGRRGNDNPAALRNSEYVRLVAARYTTCWGHSPW